MSSIISVSSSSHAVEGTLATVRPSGPNTHSSVSFRVWLCVFAAQDANSGRSVNAVRVDRAVRF